MAKLSEDNDSKKIYTGELTKHDDWGGPITATTTAGTEVFDAAAGSSVQKFVKDTLDSKWGYIYDNGKGKNYVFADQESCELYLAHEEEEEYQYLKLAEMNSYSNYRISIALNEEKTKTINAILLGQTGNEVAFTATTMDKDNVPLVEAITINYTITRPDGSSSKVTHIIQSGNEDVLNVDNYLNEGQNTVSINAVGTSSNAVANSTIVYQVINLQIEDNHTINKVFDASEGKSTSMSITWSITGSSTTSKFVEWYIDGVKQTAPSPVPSGQELGTTSANITIDADKYSHGRHNIQYRAHLTINDKTFYTPTYYKDFMVYVSGTTPIVATSLVLPIGVSPFTGETYKNPEVYDVIQYTDYNLPVSIYQNGTLNTDVKIQVVYMDGEEEKVDVSYENALTQGDIWNSTVIPTISGDSKIRITAGNSAPYTVYNINATIEKLDLDIHEVNEGLVLNLRANSKSNTAADRDQWTYQHGSTLYTTTFSGFTWDDNSGWNNNELIIAKGNSIDINYKPLTSVVKDNGLVFEVEFSTFNVSNDDAVLCKIMNDDDDNQPGIKITASEAIFQDNAKNVVSTKYKAGENNRITFVVDPDTQTKPIILIYVNGTACGAAPYNRTTSSFAANKYIHFEGTSGAEIKLRHIRIYETPLSSDNILNNYILYRNSYLEMKEIYDRNNIYATAGVFDLTQISKVLPIMLLTDYDQDRNNIQTLMNFTSTDKSTPILLRQVQYINNLDPTTNFVVEYAQMTCQGTSSMNYPTKNLRLYIKDKAKGKYGEWTLPITHTGTSMSDVEGTWASKPGKGKIAFKSGLNGTFSEGERKPQPVNCWTLKADYAESSSAHNTGVARLWNQVMRDTKLGTEFVTRTRAQALVMADPENVMDVRTTVDGFPCVIFYRNSLDDINWKFLGKFNFNNDKSTESVFGFCDIDGIEYQEYEYTESNADEYNAAVTEHPDDVQSQTQNFANVDDYIAYVRKKVGKTASTQVLEYIDYVNALCPTVYEYSKTYQKTIVTINQVEYETYYGKKVMTAGDKKNKNYCVEVLENENAVTNFLEDVSTFDEKWQEAFEFRFPEYEKVDLPDAETKGGLRNLREFYSWCHSTMATDDAYVTGQTITINAETKYDGDHIYGREKDTAETAYYANNGIYTPTSLTEFKTYQAKKFEKEKWDYLDVFKMAAYYVYFIRFGGVDQVVKNSMFTSEGTVSYVYKDSEYVESIGNHCKWFYINYDNDTILGLDNDGQLSYGPLIDRQTRTGSGSWIEHAEPTAEQKTAADRNPKFDTLDDLKYAQKIGTITPQSGDMYWVNYHEEETTGGTVITGTIYEWSNESSYAYAGHNSVLWNNLENDGEFMTIVSAIDDALHTAGLTYEKTLKMFNEKQANMWPERILNKDAQVKYIDNYTQKNLTHLGKMQGPRTSHRTWWLNKRFTYYDSKFVSGEYKSKFALFKAPVAIGTENLTFTVQPTELMNYGWGISSRSNGQTGIAATKDEEGNINPITFNLLDGGMKGLTEGDPVEIYAAPYMSKIDISNFATNLKTLNITGVYNEVLGTQLKTLILGHPSKVNTLFEVTSFEGLNVAEKLEYIDIQGMQSLGSLDFSHNLNLKEVYAFRSGLLALTLPSGSKMEKLSLPSCYNTLKLDGVNYLNYDNIIFENNNCSNLNAITIKNCTLLKEDSFKLLKKWRQQRTSFANCTVELEGINWTLTYADLDVIEYLKNNCESFKLTGKVQITDKIDTDNREETLARVERIKSIFGENCFKEELNPPVVVDCSTKFVIIYANNTEMVAKEGASTNFWCEVYPSREAGSTVLYSILEGEGFITREGTVITTNNTAGTGVLTAEEIITGTDSNLTIQVTYSRSGAIDRTSACNLLVKDPTYPTSASISGSKAVKHNETHVYDLTTLVGTSGNEATGNYSIEWTITGETGFGDYLAAYGPVVGSNNRKFYITTNENEPTVSERSKKLKISAVVTPHIGSAVSAQIEPLILNEEVIMTKDTNPIVLGIMHSAGYCGEDAMVKSDATAVTSIDGLFAGYVGSAFTFNEFVEFTNPALTTIPDSAFSNCSLTSIVLPNQIQTLGKYAFNSCVGLTSITLTSGITEISEGCFRECRALANVVLPSGVTTIRNYAFGNTNITKGVLEGEEGLVMPSGLTTIENFAFESSTQAAATSANKLVSFTFPTMLQNYGNAGTNSAHVLGGNSLKEILVSEDNIYYSSSNNVLYNKALEVLHRYPAAREGVNYDIETNCEQISAFAFYGAKYLESIAFTQNTKLTNIYDSAFQNATALKSFDMSGNTRINAIPDNCFAQCYQLTGVTFVSSVRTLGDNVFANCTSLEEIEFVEGLETMGKCIFSGCTSLTGVTFPDSLTTVGTDVFQNNPIARIECPRYMKNVRRFVYNCGGLTEIVLPYFSYMKDEEEVVVNTSINVSFTETCPSLVEFKLQEDDLKHYINVYDGALYSGDFGTLIKVPYGKTSINLNESLASIGADAFSKCSLLTNIDLPDNVSGFGQEAFIYCESLKTINNINVSSFPINLFFNCGSLESMTLENTNFTQMGGLVYYGCSNLASLTIKSLAVPTISNNTFGISSSNYIGKNVPKANRKLYVPSSMIDAYTSDTLWSSTILAADKCGYTIEAIPEETFSTPLMASATPNTVSMAEYLDLLQRLENLEKKLEGK